MLRKTQPRGPTVSLHERLSMFAKDFTIQDVERMGPIIEGLLESNKLTEDEKWAVELSCRAAHDLAQIRHSEIASAFYGRPDIEDRRANSIAEWLKQNKHASPGTVTTICGKVYVASYDAEQTLSLYPILDL